MFVPVTSCQYSYAHTLSRIQTHTLISLIKTGGIKFLEGVDLNRKWDGFQILCLIYVFQISHLYLNKSRSETLEAKNIKCPE